MARAFARIAFTPNVLALQSSMGSRSAYAPALQGAPDQVELGEFEQAFIAARDSFYLGTVGENGWPYVQHRGGPAGFLRVLGPRTLGFADYTGNRQYISAGNLAGDDRVSLFLIDYPGQRRLKIWGRARLVDEQSEPALLALIDSPHYRARVERGIVITVEALDWNCPKHITPRFTEPEIRDWLALQEASDAHPPEAMPETALGNGPLDLVVSGLRQLTPQVRAYELRRVDGSPLPAVEAGAHLVVPVRLADGHVVTRQYSIASDPAHREAWEIAVLREDQGRGGSASLQDSWQLGTRIAIDLPANQFPLSESAGHHVLIAGGIGITPLKAMAHTLNAQRRTFEFHYVARGREAFAFRAELEQAFPTQLRLHVSRGADAHPLDPLAILQAAPADTHFHVCGPARLIEAIRTAARACGVPPANIHSESFE